MTFVSEVVFEKIYTSKHGVACGAPNYRLPPTQRRNGYGVIPRVRWVAMALIKDFFDILWTISTLESSRACVHV